MFAKNYHLHWIVGRPDILSKNIIHILFNFGRGFCVYFLMLFPKAPVSCSEKKTELIFATLYFYICELKKRISDF